MPKAKRTTNSNKRERDIYQTQHPAQYGEHDMEVEKRSADGADGNRYKKVFVVLPEQWNGDDYQHDANKMAVYQEALNRGLHPKGEASYDGDHEHEDGVSVCLHYSVEVEVAAVDDQPETTVTPSLSPEAGVDDPTNPEGDSDE